MLGYKLKPPLKWIFIYKNSELWPLDLWPFWNIQFQTRKAHCDFRPPSFFCPSWIRKGKRTHRSKYSSLFNLHQSPFSKGSSPLAWETFTPPLGVRRAIKQSFRLGEVNLLVKQTVRTVRNYPNYPIVQCNYSRACPFFRLWHGMTIIMSDQ